MNWSKSVVHLVTQIVYHQWKGDGGGFDALDNPHESKAHELYEREQVNSAEFDMTQIDVVRLILDRHQYDQQTVVELHTYTTINHQYNASSTLIST